MMRRIFPQPFYPHLRQPVTRCGATIGYFGAPVFAHDNRDWEADAQAELKLVFHWDATISRLVGDKGLRYERDFLPFFTLRSHWTL